MNTPEEETRFAQAFDEFGEAAELMVEPPSTGVIRQRVRRRRVTRVAVAGFAAIALAAPTSWMLQQVATAEEQEAPPADDRTTETVVEATPTEAPTTPAEAATTETDTESAAPPVLPTFDDLVGTTLELPSFGDSTEEICPAAPATLTAAGGDGPVYLLKVVHASLTADGPEQAVALVGCSPGEAMIRQVLVIEADGDGYKVAEQLYRYDYGVNGSVYDIAPAADYGLFLGVIEQEPCCSNLPEHFDQWIERYRDGGFEKLSGAVPGTYVTDLRPSIEVTDTGTGTWEVRVTVENAGNGESAPFELWFCSNEAMRLEDGTTGACPDGIAVESAEGLAAGDVYETVWTVTTDPKAEWSDEEVQYGQSFQVEVKMPRYGTEALVFETATGNNSQAHTFAYDEMD
ncbi:hypothetical protein [Glycomyces sp. NPDC048151]|uniref:hypothetical protein n=1 Tax=Glycomyces sp. NPDC048151 TaxID=3364002 RepID=UPI00371066EA